jgi:hypothetical protein
MKISNRSLLAIICLITNMAGNTVEQPPIGAQAKDWYTDWVRSQENPYIKMRVLELGKKISKQRGKVVDTDPRGWFKRFLLERVRGKLVVEAYEARKGELSTPTWKLTFMIKLAKNLFKIYYLFKHDLAKSMSN